MKSNLIALGIFAALVSAAAEESKEPVVPRPGKFVDGAHESSYATYEGVLNSADDKAKRNKTELIPVLQRSVGQRVSQLAGTESPDKVRELQKIANAWFKVEGEATITEAVPEELAGVVSGYRSMLQNIDSEKDREYRQAYRALRGQWLRQAEGHNAAPDGEEKAETLLTLVSELMIVPDALNNWGDTEIATYHWDHKGPHFTQMHKHGDELLSLAFISGNMAGGGERLLLESKFGEVLGFDAQSAQPSLKATVYAIRHPQLKLDDWNIRTRSIWRSDYRKKLIHKSRGFCYLAGIWGSWGEMTDADIKLDPKDGFYYLHFRSENLWSGAHAVIVEFPKTAAIPDFTMSTVEWTRGDPVKELIDARDGVCLFTGISGALKGGEVMLTVGVNGKWQLGGKTSHLKTGVKALILEFE